MLFVGHFGLLLLESVSADFLLAISRHVEVELDSMLGDHSAKAVEVILEPRECICSVNVASKSALLGGGDGGSIKHHKPCTHLHVSQPSAPQSSSSPALPLPS